MSDVNTETTQIADPVLQPVQTPASVQVKPGSPEHKAILASKAPANLPDKFKNADGTANIEALTTAYREAEQKITANGQAAANTNDTKTVGTVSLDAAFAAAESPKVSTLEVAEAELQVNGKLAPETIESLKKNHNLTDASIGAFIEGFNARQQQLGQSLSAAVGGQENLDKVIAHAKATMTETQLRDLRTSLKGQFGPTILKGLAMDMKLTTMQPSGQTPTITPASEVGAASTTASGSSRPQPFRDQAEYLAAFQNPKYKIDPDYRRQCAMRAHATQEQQAGRR